MVAERGEAPAQARRAGVRRAVRVWCACVQRARIERRVQREREVSEECPEYSTRAMQ